MRHAATLRDLVRIYMAESRSTAMGSAIRPKYAPELRFFLRELGAESLLESLTPSDIAAVLESPAIQIDEDDRPRSAFGIARVRRAIAETIRFGVICGWIADELLDVVAAYDHLLWNPGISWNGAES